jgi:hypothetical protein
MATPKVTITTLDGGLGTVPNQGGKLVAVLGPASAGVFETPQGIARPKDVIAGFTSGPLVEWSTYFQSRYGRGAIPIRTHATGTAGSAGHLDVTGVAGTSVATIASSPTPPDDLDVVFQVVAGGTIGTDGITYQYSLDGGRTLSPVTALGTADTLTIPGTGTELDFAAGTLLAGDKLTFTTVAPAPSASELATGLTALQNSNLPWEFAFIASPITAALLDQLETSFAAMQAAGKYRAWIGSPRMPTPGETEAEYKTALDAIFASKATTIGSLYSGDAKTFSAVSGRIYRRPSGLSVAAFQASVSEEIDIADVDLGPVPGVSIVDNNGNPENHDEAVFPGLDDSRFGTLRSWDGRSGVYVTRPRVFSSAGSDFSIMPYRRVMNLYAETLLFYMTRRLAKPIRISKKTGFIVEVDALEIELGAQKSLEAVLMKKPKASAVTFTVSRSDDLLSTKTLTGDGGLIPLAYPEFILLSIGFKNPSLQLIKV